MKRSLILTAICVMTAVAGLTAWTMTNSTVDKRVALTFDDGPTPGFTNQILDTLKRKDVKATFFVTGAQAEAHPALIKRIASEGHVLGNHSYSGKTFDKLTQEQIFNELLGTQQIISNITGESPRFVRNPQGIETAASRAATRELKLTGHVHWHYDSSAVGQDDWTCGGAEATLNFAKKATKPGAIILAHDGNEVTKCPEQLAWLEQYLDWAKSEGYEFGFLKPADAPSKLNGHSWVEVVPVTKE